MLHRFNHPDRGIVGHDPLVVGRVLQWLRDERFELLDVEELLRRADGSGPPLRRAVAFTIDDGYADHAEVAAPLFARFDCPVTTFVVSGFLDGNLWLWWDQVEWLFAHSRATRVSVSLGDQVFSATWDAGSVRAASAAFVERCKLVSQEAKERGIRGLAECLAVELPSAPPSQVAPMSWDDLRRAEASGMRFGPHTVTHPVLSRTTDQQAGHEIMESWARVRQEASRPSSVFCYPNGQASDFSEREVAILGRAGLDWAVTGELGYAGRSRGDGDRYRVRRFPFPDDLTVAAQYAGGFERLKAMLRGQE